MFNTLDSMLQEALLNLEYAFTTLEVTLKRFALKKTAHFKQMLEVQRFGISINGKME